MILQKTTADLWATLCGDFYRRQTDASESVRFEAVESFVASAKEVFKKHLRRLSDAFEMAGDTHQSCQSLSAAKAYYEEALKWASEVRSRSRCARLETKLGMLAENQRDDREASRFFLEAIRHYEAYGDCTSVPCLYSYIAGITYRQGKADKAETYYTLAVKKSESLFGEDHPELAIHLNNRGIFFSEIGKFSQAEDDHLRALGIRERVFGAHHPDIGRSMHNLAVTYHLRGDSERAERFYEGALAILESALSAHDPELLTIHSNFQALRAYLLSRK